jgi:hypothetical protein
MRISSHCHSGRFLVLPEPSRGAVHPPRTSRYPSSIIKLIGLILIGWACLTGCLAWAEVEPAAQPDRLFGNTQVAEAVAKASSNTTWIGIAGIVTIVVNGAVTVAIAISKNKQDTAAKIADSEARTAVKVAEAREQVRAEIAEREELDRERRHRLRDQDGLVINELREQLTANTDAIAAIPRRTSDANAGVRQRSSDARS